MSPADLERLLTEIDEAVARFRPPRARMTLGDLKRLLAQRWEEEANQHYVPSPGDHSMCGHACTGGDPKWCGG